MDAESDRGRVEEVEGQIDKERIQRVVTRICGKKTQTP